MFSSRKRVAEFRDLTVDLETARANPALDFATGTVSGSRQYFLNTLSQ